MTSLYFSFLGCECGPKKNQQKAHITKIKKMFQKFIWQMPFLQKKALRQLHKRPQSPWWQ